MQFLFLLILVRLISSAIIFYIVYEYTVQSLIAFYQIASSLVMDDIIQDLKKAIPFFGEFMFLPIMPHLLNIPGDGIVLFDVAAVLFFELLLNSHTCTKVKHVCFGVQWYLVGSYNVIYCHQILTIL